jgi:hypothetical protein
MHRPRLSRPTIILATVLTLAAVPALAGPAHHEQVAMTLVAVAETPSATPSPAPPPSPGPNPSPSSAVPSEPPTPQPTTAPPAPPRPTAEPARTTAPPAPPAPTGDARAYARSQVGDAQFACLDTLWGHESGWDSTASNPSSGAYGIPQALPGSKMASAGADWRSNAVTQIRWGISYIHSRYGTPCSAWSFWQAHHWY